MFSNWKWTQWAILIGGILVIIVSSIIIYALLRPDTFVPQRQVPSSQDIGGFPTPQIGAPDFPASPIEQIPLTQIQGIPTDQIDLVARGGITQVENLTDFPVGAVSIASNGSDLIFFDPETRRFFFIDSNGVIVKISSQVFAEIDNVAFADNGADSVIEFPDGSNIVFNFDTNEQVTLPSHWEDFDFSPDSNQLAFKSMALEEQERWLAIANKNGGGAKRIEHLGKNADKVDVNWSPNNQVIATFQNPSGLNSAEVFFIGQNGENFPVSNVRGLKFEGQFSPDGTDLVHSVTHQETNFNPTLWVVDGSGNSVGQNRQRIGLNTWSDKCVFQENKVAICGVPRDLPQGAGLIRSVADNVSDDLFKVDLQTGATSRIAIPENDLNVENIVISEDGKTVVIKDKFTQTLKKVLVD